MKNFFDEVIIRALYAFIFWFWFRVFVLSIIAAAFVVPWLLFFGQAEGRG